MSVVAAAQAALGEEQWEAAFADGKAVTSEEAVAKVLEKGDETMTSGPSSTWRRQ
jgi:hypothetical protein